MRDVSRTRADLKHARGAHARVSDPLATYLRALEVDVSVEPLAIVGLPATAWPAVAAAGFVDPARGDSVIATPDELTLLVDLPWEVVGFAARVTSALAEAGVSVGMLASERRDHLLVPEARVDDALAALERLRKSVP